MLLLSSCGVAQTAGTTSPTPSQSVVASLTPSATTGKEQTGRLPVIGTADDAVGNIQNAGGFIQLPGGAFTLDPAARMVADSARHAWRTQAAPYLFGIGDSPAGRISYDRVAGRWLPVAASQVTPDGMHYAYVEAIMPAATGSQPGPGPIASGERIHVVDVRTASDTVVFSHSGDPYYTIAGFSQQGVYLTAACVEGCSQHSLMLWRLNPSTGAITKVSDRQGFNWQIHEPYAWVGSYGESTPRLLRIDLRTGAVSSWLTVAGLEFLGLDHEGLPLATVNGVDRSHLLLVTAPGQSLQLFSGPSNGQFIAAVADQTATWIGGGQSGDEGIYVYTGGSALRKAGTFAGLPVGPLS